MCMYSTNSTLYCVFMCVCGEERERECVYVSRFINNLTFTSNVKNKYPSENITDALISLC